jgi:hypothetical protein
VVHDRSFCTYHDCIWKVTCESLEGPLEDAVGVSQRIIAVMVETLYKTDTPEVGVSECYELVILAEASKGPGGYSFKEIHGWWDDNDKRFINNVVTINPDEDLTWEEAERMYKAARLNRARSGFIHAFSPDYSGQGTNSYERIAID